MEKNVQPLCIKLSERVKQDDYDSNDLFDRMYYDPADGINKVKINDRVVPAVLAGSLLGTQTFTRVIEETTDSDFHKNNSFSLSTRTYTEAQAESTDEDLSDFHFPAYRIY